MALSEARSRTTSQALNELNQTVTGFIDKNCSAEDVRDGLERSREVVGQHQVAIAESTVREVVGHRLRTSATACVLEGRKRLGNHHVTAFSESMREAKAAGVLDGRVDFDEFELLLSNFDAKVKAARISEGTTAANLRMLVPMLDLTQQPQLTDWTLATLCRGILQVLRKNPETACREAKKLGLADRVRRLLLDTKEGKRASPGAVVDHPDLQAGLALILAELGLADAQKSSSQHKTWRQLKPMLGSTEIVGSVVETSPPSSPLGSSERPGLKRASTMSRVGLLQGIGALSDEVKPVPTLVKGMQQGLQRQEHSLVWAILLGLRRLAQHPVGRLQLLVAGALPVLLRAREKYSEAGADLPPPKPPPQVVPPVAVSKEPPAFIGLNNSGPALNRFGESTKERWFRQSTSLPELPSVAAAAAAAAERKESSCRSADFLHSSPSAAKTRGRSFSSTRSMKKRATSSSAAAAALAAAPPMPPPGVPLNTHTLQIPPLLWLLAEDSIQEDVIYQVCNRDFLLLQVSAVVGQLEKDRHRLAGTFSKAPTNPLKLSPRPSSPLRRTA